MPVVVGHGGTGTPVPVAVGPGGTGMPGPVPEGGGNGELGSRQQRAEHAPLGSNESPTTVAFEPSQTARAKSFT